MLWVDASLADDLRDSKSTSGAYLAIVGPICFAPIMSFAKKQTAVAHSSTESEISAFEEAVRTEGLPILTFWETIVCILSDRLATMLTSVTGSNKPIKQSFDNPLHPKTPDRDSVRRPVRAGGGRSTATGLHNDNIFSIAGELMSIIPFRFDHVEIFFAVREFSGLVDLIIAEDNEATIKILLKCRSTNMRHVHRTHRVNLDWLYEVFSSNNSRC